MLGLALTPTGLGCAITEELASWTARAAEAFGLEPDLVRAVVWVESRYCVDALSPAGAVGLGQLMPATAAGLGVDPADPWENLWGTARYLREQFDAFGSWPLALAAYHAGPTAVRRYGGVPPYPETRAYVRDVLRDYSAVSRP